MIDPAAQERFWAKVDKRGPDECWPWRASANQQGRGQFYLNGKTRIAAQVAWTIQNRAPFPVGKGACHTCDNPPCVNPAHIWPGDQRENLHDCRAKGRLNSAPRLTRCGKGHDLVEGNIRLDGKYIRCAICTREREKRYDARRRPKASTAMIQAALEGK